MPLSPEMRTKFIDLTGADKSASEDVLLGAVLTELDARKKDIAALADKVKSVTTLSADVTRLNAELKTAKDDADAKGKQVMQLSANAPAKADPLAVSMFTETFGNRAEDAIRAGMPQAAVDYFSSLVKAPDGTLNVLALSACDVPAGEGKTKPSRLAVAVMDGLAKLAQGGFGQGVPTGFTPPKGGATLQLSSSDPTGALAIEEKAADEAAKNYAAGKRGSQPD